MWPFKNRQEPPSLPPIPPTNLTLSKYKTAQDDYVAKHDKLVKPTQQTMVEAAKQAAEFGKSVINYMVVGNAGGLAALMVMAPIMHDTNKLWLAQQLSTAVAFGIGAALGVAIAVVAHFNYASHTGYFWAQSKRDEAWLRAIEFELGHQWHSATDAWLAHQQETTNRRANVTNLLAVVVFLASAACWLYGAVSLVMSVRGLTLG